MKRVSLYIRVSTASQTTENQRRELEQYCQRQGWKVGKVYDDSGFSGSQNDRPALNQLMQDVRAGKAGDIVCVWKIDRLARSTSHLLSILNELKNAGVDFVSTTQAIDTTTSYGKMVLTFLGAISEFERDTIIERVKCGISRARANGVKLGRPRVAVDLKTALKLRQHGLGYKQIAKVMNVPRSTLFDTFKAMGTIRQTPAA